MTKTGLLKVGKRIKSPNNIVLLSSVRKIQVRHKHQKEKKNLLMNFFDD